MGSSGKNTQLLPISQGLVTLLPPSEIVFQEQSYSSLHSGRSLTWDHFRGDINDHCSVIADFSRVIDDPCGIVVIPEAIVEETLTSCKYVSLFLISILYIYIKLKKLRDDPHIF